jgi:Glycosyltransferase family 92
LKDGTHVGPITVEVIDETPRGDLVICVGMFYTSNPILYRWLDHYRALGVNHFQIYYTVSEGTPYGVGHETFLYGDPTRIFDSADITWHFTGKGNHGPVFSMHMFLSECAHRYKYSYKYMLAIDPDEFLVLNASLHGYPNLARIVDHHLPRGREVLKMCRWHYSRTCPVNDTLSGMDLAQDYTTPGFFSHWKRDPEPDCAYGKSIVRPRFVDAMGPHGPYALSAHAPSGGVELPPSKAYFQHWSSRKTESRGDLDLTECKALAVQKETFVSSIWFL